MLSYLIFAAIPVQFIPIFKCLYYNFEQSLLLYLTLFLQDLYEGCLNMRTQLFRMASQSAEDKDDTLCKYTFAWLKMVRWQRFIDTIPIP